MSYNLKYLTTFFHNFFKKITGEKMRITFLQSKRKNKKVLEWGRKKVSKSSTPHIGLVCLPPEARSPDCWPIADRGYPGGRPLARVVRVYG